MSREIMQQALDALLHMCNTTKAQNDYNAKIVDKALVALEAALAQPEQDAGKCGCGANLYIDVDGKPCSKAQTEQKPVAWMYEIFGDTVLTTNQKKIDLVLANEKTVTPLYTAPSSKEWVGLTDDEINKIVDLNTSDHSGFDIWCDGIAVAHIVCAKLKEKNGGNNT